MDILGSISSSTIPAPYDPSTPPPQLDAPTRYISIGSSGVSFGVQDNAYLVTYLSIMDYPQGNTQIGIVDIRSTANAAYLFLSDPGITLRSTGNNDGLIVSANGQDLYINDFVQGYHFDAYGYYVQSGSNFFFATGADIADGQSIPTAQNFYLEHGATTEYILGAVLTDGSHVDLRHGAPLTGTATGDTLYDFGIDPHTGQAFNDTIHGAAGNDVIFSTAGDDLLYGDDGDDTIHAGRGNDIIDGGGGFNTASLNYSDRTGSVVLINGATTGVTYTTTVNEEAAGSIKNIQVLNIVGGSGNDTLGGNYSVLSGAQARLDGGAGTDTLVVDTSGFVEHIGGGLDGFVLQAGQYPNTFPVGILQAVNFEKLQYIGDASGYDGVRGGTGDDTLTGLARDDTFRGGGGNDIIDGGGGFNTADFDGSHSDYTVVIVNYITSVTDNRPSSSHGTSTLVNIQHLAFADQVVDLATGPRLVSGSPNAETLTGDDIGDRINGLGGDDKLNGGKGNDTLDGGPGDDTMAGGKGNDVYYVDSSADGVSEKAGEGTDTVYTSANWFTTPGSEIEKLVATGSRQLQLWGNGLSMEVDGNGAVNRLDDGVSPAVLAASAARFAAAVAPSAPSITLAGGDGSDVYYVHGAGTQVVEAVGQGYDTVRTDLSSFILPANVEALSYIGVGDFTGTGNAQSNVIAGGGGNDTLDGGANTDGKGDRLVGGLGDDTYYVHSAKDFVAENAGGGFDTVYTTANSAVANPNVEALRFIGSGAFTGFAAATGTSIAGGAGSDKLYGGAGADTLDAGSAGSDLLTGKGGADTFILHPNGVGVVHVSDFQPGVDHVELDVNTYDPGTGEPQLNGGVEFDLAFLAYAHGGDGIHGAFAVPFYYDAATGDLYDTTTVPAGPEYGGFLDFVTVPNAVIAHFDNHPALTSSDFVFGLAG